MASDITGVSGRMLLQALIEGQDDPAALAELAQRRRRFKIPEFTDALTGRFSRHHRYMAELCLHRIDVHTADVEALSSGIEEAIAPFRLTRELLTSIPGFSTTIAEVRVPQRGAPGILGRHRGQFATWPGTLSRNERGLSRDDALAHDYRNWLAEQDTGKERS